MKALRIFSAERRGSAAIEFAFVLPVLIMFIGGIVEVGRLFLDYSAVNRLATRFAITYADCSDVPAGACKTELVTFASSFAQLNIVPQLGTAPTVRMFQVEMSNASPPAATIDYATPAGATLTSAELAQAQTSIGAGNTGVVVSAAYTYTPAFFANVMNKIISTGSRTISYTVAQRKS